MSNNLKVGVEVEKGEDGLFTKESVCKAVNKVMEVDSEVGREVRANHAKLRELLSSEDLESSYMMVSVRILKIWLDNLSF